MWHFFRSSWAQEMRSLPDWATALALFAAASFLVAWPLRDMQLVITQIGPSAIWAFIIISQFLIFARSFSADTASGWLVVAVGQNLRGATDYAWGKLLTASVTATLYALAATGLGILFFSLELDAALVLFTQVMICAPAVGAVSLSTAALTSGARANASALGIVVLLPQLAPLVIFLNIHQAQAAQEGTFAVPALAALAGLSILYILASTLALPRMLRATL